MTTIEQVIKEMRAATDGASDETVEDWANQLDAEVRRGPVATAAEVLTARGVFKNADCIERFAECGAFWSEQMYETRFYFGPNINDYIHRGILRAAIEAIKFAAPQPAIPDWRPIESAPKDGTVILVHGGIAYWRERNNHWENEGWFSLTGFDWPGRPIQWNVTHWMPLPPPPSGDAGKEGGL